MANNWGDISNDDTDSDRDDRDDRPGSESVARLVFLLAAVVTIVIGGAVGAWFLMASRARDARVMEERMVMEAQAEQMQRGQAK